MKLSRAGPKSGPHVRRARIGGHYPDNITQGGHYPENISKGNGGIDRFEVIGRRPIVPPWI